MSLPNALAYCGQLALVVLICAPLPRVLGLRSAAVQHFFWRTLLLVCLLLPAVEPWRPGEMAFVPAPQQPAAAAVSALAPPGPAAPLAQGSLSLLDVAMLVAAVGAAARLAWIVIGIGRLRRMRRNARDTAAGFEDLQAAIGVVAPVCWSAEITHPVTFGSMRPIVLLPDTLKTADTAVQRAVVAHELHHVKRRDWMWTIAEEIVRSVFWFHPAMWWLVSRVQLAREAVVDELSILTTNARRAYVDALLALADGSALSSSTAFSARRHLFHRVMLIAKEGGMSSVRIAAISGILAAALGAGSWTAVSAFPLHGATDLQSAVPRDPHAPPPRDPQTRETYQRQAEEYWERANRDLTLTPDEKIQTIFKGIEATDRALALDRDYVPALAYKNIFLRMAANLSSDPAERERLITQANELRDKAIALRGAGVTEPVDPAAPPPPPPPPPPGGPEMLFMPQSFARHVSELDPVHIGGDVKAPIKIRDVRPVYPPLAQQSHVTGVVIIEILLDDSGSVLDARVLRSIPLLDQAALEAVKQWQFTPVLVNGAPHAALITVTANFTLQ